MELLGAIIVIIGGAIGITALIITSAIIRGFVLTKLWAWFLVPTFGVPKISIPVAIGLALIVGFLTEKITEHKDDRETSDKVAAAITTFLSPFVILLIGWIITWFV